MRRRRTRRSKTRRWLEALLLLGGLTGVGIFAWSHLRMVIYQSRANRALEHQIQNRSATAVPPQAAPAAPAPPLKNGALLGRLEIPSLNLRAVVREGAGADTLDVALGHIPGTALPGQPGNVGVAGHRDTLFRSLRKIEKNDLIEFQTPKGNYEYQVESTGIVKPQDVGVLRSGPHPEMTLVTCYPFYYVGSAPDRFIVKARLVSPPDSPAAAARHTIADVRPVDPPAGPKPQPADPKPRLEQARRPQSGLFIHKVGFRLKAGQSRLVAPGIRLGLSGTDRAQGRASVWMFVTPERHTIWLNNQAVHRAVFFDGHADGRRRALMITSVTADSISGYMLIYTAGRAPSPVWSSTASSAPS